MPGPAGFATASLEALTSLRSGRRSARRSPSLLGKGGCHEAVKSALLHFVWCEYDLSLATMGDPRELKQGLTASCVYLLIPFKTLLEAASAESIAVGLP